MSRCESLVISASRTHARDGSRSIADSKSKIRAFLEHTLVATAQDQKVTHNGSDPKGQIVEVDRRDLLVAVGALGLEHTIHVPVRAAVGVQALVSVVASQRRSRSRVLSRMRPMPPSITLLPPFPEPASQRHTHRPARTRSSRWAHPEPYALCGLFSALAERRARPTLDRGLIPTLSSKLGVVREPIVCRPKQGRQPKRRDLLESGDRLKTRKTGLDQVF